MDSCVKIIPSLLNKRNNFYPLTLCSLICFMKTVCATYKYKNELSHRNYTFILVEWRAAQSQKCAKSRFGRLHRLAYLETFKGRKTTETTGNRERRRRRTNRKTITKGIYQTMRKIFLTAKYFLLLFL